MRNILHTLRPILTEHGPGGSHQEAGCACRECRPTCTEPINGQLYVTERR